MTVITSPTTDSHARKLPAALWDALDTSRMQRALNAHWPWLHHRERRLSHLEVHRVFPQRNDGFVVKYTGRIEGDVPEEITFFAQASALPARKMLERALSKLRKSRRKQISRNRETDALAVLPGLELLIRMPGYDERLPGLRVRYRSDSIWALLGTSPASEPPRFRVLNHRLGKRCVLGVSWRDARGEHRTAVIRCLREQRVEHQRNRIDLERLRAHGFDESATDGIRVPRVLGCSDDLRAVAIEFAPGFVLGTSLERPLPEQMARAGTALAKLHGTPAWTARFHGVNQELKILRQWVPLASLLRPELAQAYHQALAEVTRRLDACRNRPPVLAHRDFYNKQMLYDGQWTTLIDFDTLSLADPALDMGNHLAHRRLARLAGEPWSADERAAFLEAYGQRKPLPPPTALDAWERAAALRMACLYAARTGWVDICEKLLGSVNESE